MLKRFLKTLLFVLLLPLIGGYLGLVHPAGDSLAVFRPYLAAGAGILGIILWFARVRIAAAIALMVLIGALGPILWMHSSAIASLRSDLSLYQKNMLFLVNDPSLLGKDILTRAPDFITLQEVSGANMAVFEGLGDAYQSRQFCPFATVGGVAVASRWPIVKGSAFCAESDGLAAMQVSSPKGDIWVVSVHLHWPWPYSQPNHLKRLLPLLENLSGPVVIGGDFNMVPWSHALRQLEQVSNTKRIGPPHVTLTKMGGWARFPIDHVFVSGGQGTTHRLSRLGSDHYGLLARFKL